MGAGGVLLRPVGYIETAAQVCARHGVLFVSDVVICGFGRLGTWYGIERFGVTPNMIVFAKRVSSGYLPLGGVVIAGNIAEPLWSPELGHSFRYGTTYAGHLTSCVAALTNVDILEEEGLLARSRQLESELAHTLRSNSGHPAVAEVCCRTGFLGAVELEAGLPARRTGCHQTDSRDARARRYRHTVAASYRRHPQQGARFFWPAWCAR